jgi:hypothetical protein
MGLLNVPADGMVAAEGDPAQPDSAAYAALGGKLVPLCTSRLVTRRESRPARITVVGYPDNKIMTAHNTSGGAPYHFSPPRINANIPALRSNPARLKVAGSEWPRTVSTNE